jgi:hypothetical protein
MTFQDLLAYKKIIFISGEDFWNNKIISKRGNLLTDQIRRSSRSVPVTMAEGTEKEFTQNIFTVN